MTATPVWVVVADPLTARTFFDCRIVERLAARLGERLRVAFTFRGPMRMSGPHVRRGVRTIGDLYPTPCRPSVPRGVPIAGSTSRSGTSRSRSGSTCVTASIGADAARTPEPASRFEPRRPAPVRPRVEQAMRRWHFSPRRRRAPCGVAWRRAARPRPLEPPDAIRDAFIVLGRRLGLTAVGYVASWDHTVGKGVIWNGLERYVVQNERMREDLVRYHDVDRGRIVVTGWPQADVFHGGDRVARSTTSCVDTASTRRGRSWW